MTGRFRIGSPLWAFIRLARPHFLVGGFLLYGLGTAMARYEGHAVDWTLYAVGQWFATSVQLMTQFANEFWDVDADRANPNRTLFSGGSGVIAGGELSRPVARAASVVCLCSALAAALVLGVVFRAGPVVWLVMALAVGGAWFYSSPPLALAATGFGELTTSLLVALLLPAFADLLQTETLTPPLFWATIPLAALHFAMLLAFEVPDLAADETAGKRTLLVRLGLRRGEWAHGAAIVAGFGLLAVGSRLHDAPTMGLLTVPMAAIQMGQLHSIIHGHNRSFGRLTFGAVSLFAVTAALVMYGFWRTR